MHYFAASGRRAVDSISISLQSYKHDVSDRNGIHATATPLGSIIFLNSGIETGVQNIQRKGRIPIH